MAVNIKQEALSSFPYSSVNVMDDEKSMQQSLLKKGIKAEVDTKFTKPLRVDVAAANNYQNVSSVIVVLCINTEQATTTLKTCIRQQYLSE